MESIQSKAEVVYLEEGKESAQDTADNVAEVEVHREATGDLKLDKHGLPLVPQPSDRKDDPLVRGQPQSSVPLTDKR
jgi:hypothetical protein